MYRPKETLVRLDAILNVTLKRGCEGRVDLKSLQWHALNNSARSYNFDNFQNSSWSFCLLIFFFSEKYVSSAEQSVCYNSSLKGRRLRHFL